MLAAILMFSDDDHHACTLHELEIIGDQELSSVLLKAELRPYHSPSQAVRLTKMSSVCFRLKIF